jgi:ferrous iron transport protein B
VGGVLGFVPLILLMFLQISILEDSGYMARVAYMLDRVFRAFGLHGYSVMPFVISGGIAGGCAVPGIMAARTLRSPKERLATILTSPLMTCGAKMPVFLLLAAAFFPGQETNVMMLIWLTAWTSALLVARVLRSTLLKGDPTPFVMELPPYRMPTALGVLIHTWERIWQYIKKAGTVILAISIIVWASMTFPSLPEELASPYAEAIAAAEEALESAQGEEAGAEPAPAAAEGEEDPLEAALTEAEAALAAAGLEYSIAGRVGHSLETITAPAGFDWRTNIALVAGLGAKEVVVSTMGTAYSLGEVDPEEAESLSARIANDPHWNKANAAALMIFTLLYAPCFVTVVIIGQESGSWKWSVFSLVFNTLLAFVAAVVVYQLGLLLI